MTEQIEMEPQTFKIDLLKVLHTIEKNENNPKCENVPEILGISKRFEDDVPTRKINAIYVEHDSKTKVLAEFIKLVIERCTTDEEAFYMLYHAIMQFAIDASTCDMPPLLKMLMRGRDEG